MQARAAGSARPAASRPLRPAEGWPPGSDRAPGAAATQGWGPPLTPAAAGRRRGPPAGRRAGEDEAEHQGRE